MRSSAFGMLLFGATRALISLKAAPDRTRGIRGQGLYARFSISMPGIVQPRGSGRR